MTIFVTDTDNGSGFGHLCTILNSKRSFFCLRRRPGEDGFQMQRKCKINMNSIVRALKNQRYIECFSCIGPERRLLHDGVALRGGRRGLRL